MIQINAAARTPPKMADGKDGFPSIKPRDCDYRSQRGCNRLRRVFHLGRTMKAGVTPKLSPTSSTRFRRTQGSPWSPLARPRNYSSANGRCCPAKGGPYAERFRYSSCCSREQRLLGPRMLRQAGFIASPDKFAAKHDADDARVTIRVAASSMPDLSLPDFSDATGKVMSEFNTFTQQVGDALPILEQMGYEVTVFKVTWACRPRLVFG